MFSQLLLVCTDQSAVSPVRQLLESVPASVQQDAVRGQALVLKQQGNMAAAKQLLADLVQSEGLEGACQHLAQADYGILLLEQADLQVLPHARLHVLNIVGNVVVDIVMTIIIITIVAQSFIIIGAYHAVLLPNVHCVSYVWL